MWVGSADTILTRDQSTRLYFMECQSCASKRTVPPIKMGKLLSRSCPPLPPPFAWSEWLWLLTCPCVSSGFQAQIGKRRAMKG